MSVGTTIFFAGSEVETLARALVNNGIRNILWSYFYVWTMQRTQGCDDIQEQYPDANFFLDSGAFTYGVKHYAEPGRLPNTDRYVKYYFSYIEEYGYRYCRIAEPDLDIAHVPLEKVDRWREEMLERWPHLNVCPVWHPSRGIEEWRRYIKDPRIKTLAMGSDVRHEGMGKTRRMVLEAHEAGKPVHGFGMTKINTVLKYVPYDSVDSTTVWTGQQYGHTYIFRANKFITFPGEKKHYRAKYKTYYRNIGCDPQKVIDDDVAEVRKANIIAWKHLADRLEYIKRLGNQMRGSAAMVRSPHLAAEVEGTKAAVGNQYSYDEVLLSPHRTYLKQRDEQEQDDDESNSGH